MVCALCSSDPASQAACGVCSAMAARREKLRECRAQGKFAKFQSLGLKARNRRESRARMRKMRLRNKPAGKVIKKPACSASSVSRPGRNMKVPCCGRRADNCRCFASGRGLAIATSFDTSLFATIPGRVSHSPIQYWSDTGDMTKWAEQIAAIGRGGVQYRWLFPVAMMWRQWSNGEFWDALVAQGSFID